MVDPQATTGFTDLGPTAEHQQTALSEFHDAANALLGMHLARTRQADPVRFELVRATLQAGGFVRVQTSFEQQGAVLDTGIWLHGPFGGSTELWNFADDFPLNKVR